MNEDTNCAPENKPRLRTAIQRMMDARNLPPIQALLGAIWQVNELLILFADTGIGKSIFAVAIGDAISKGISFLGLENAFQPQIVLYYDFELTDRQFRKRYTDEFGNEYQFSENFIIDNIDFKEFYKENEKVDFLKTIMQRFREDLTATKATVLIIDNLTFLNVESSQDTEVALKVMRELHTLKIELNISILVLAHTPKRAMSAPITINDLAGSKMLPNFSDCICAIGMSKKDENYRYIKQIKPSRSCEMEYHEDNILVIEKIKETSFLTFKLIECAVESDHLYKTEQSNVIPDVVHNVAKRIKHGEKYDDVAKEFRIAKGTISKWRKNTKYAHLFVSVSTVSDDEHTGNMETGNE